MHLKLIISDGSGIIPKGRVAVVNRATGEELRLVRKVSFLADAANGFQPVITIEVEADIDIDTIGMIEAMRVAHD